MINPNAKYHSFLKSYAQKQRETYRELKDAVVVQSLTMRDTNTTRHLITPEGLEAYRVDAVQLLRGLN